MSERVILLEEQILSLQNADSVQLQCECVNSLCTKYVVNEYSQLENFAKSIIPIFSSIINNSESNPQLSFTLIVMLPSFCESLMNQICSETKQNQKKRDFSSGMNEFFNNNVSPLFQKFVSLKGNQGQIRKAMQSYADLCCLLNSDFLTSQVTILKVISEDNRAEVCHSLVSFLIDVVELYTTDLFTFIENLILKLMKDVRPAIRQEAPKLIAAYIKVAVGVEEVETLSQNYLTLSQSPSTIVRATAAQFLSIFLRDIDERYLIQFGYPIMNQLLNDKTTIVSKSIIAKSGEYIAYFGPDSDAELIKRYKTRLNSRIVEESYQAAYSFPGVITALGRKFFNDFELPFMNALNSSNVNIRKTLSYGLINYAHFFTQERLEEVCIKLLNDQPIVLQGILSNLYQIIQFIDDKNSLVFCLENPAKRYSKDWRCRKMVSEQIRYCLESFDKEKLFQSALELVRDEIAIVRKDAASTVALMLDETNHICIADLSKSENFWERWAAASILSICDIGIAEKYIGTLQTLCNDRASTVRIASANAASIISQQSGMAKSFLKDSMEKLRNDLDPTVCQIVEAM